MVRGTRRPRLSQEDTAARLLAAAVQQVNATGLTVSIGHLSFEAVIEAADVSRTAAYRRWPNKEQFLADLVRELARAATPQEVVQDASWGLITTMVLTDAGDLADPDRRRGLVVELIRRAADRDFQVMYASSEWRTYLALNATFASFGDAEVQAALAAAQRRFIEGIVAGWSHLASLFGFRLRPGPIGYDALAAMVSASVRGMLLMALADPEIASRRVIADPLGTGPAEWSLAALSCAGIAAAFVEPDPDFNWDADAAQALQAALASAPSGQRH